ncbi:hypothetical protein MPTK1_2g08620 [Marchantia polymorpha subsp. ruderalis]|uniref:Uncharacterized protein n=1 Tax=Marchantia polymorpha TaxID=3197 RepID=A0A2R6XGV4_MARPO|nr:hypothetical protein MARPO_0015s0147 [Marchantia polymorpha]BBN01586.1 hypothetical protein Mp_2g08620 [Marchantia polymorpha subsp. ruderalis]|eukprot:PTQ45353.1 hypothetical protein MARPO_0015s0147 [Marchantia polymorpha]
MRNEGWAQTVLRPGRGRAWTERSGRGAVAGASGGGRVRPLSPALGLGLDRGGLASRKAGGEALLNGERARHRGSGKDRKLVNVQTKALSVASKERERAMVIIVAGTMQMRWWCRPDDIRPG